jgi:hypothetical protein
MAASSGLRVWRIPRARSIVFLRQRRLGDQPSVARTAAYRHLGFRVDGEGPAYGRAATLDRARPSNPRRSNPDLFSRHNVVRHRNPRIRSIHDLPYRAIRRRQIEATPIRHVFLISSAIVAL